MGPKPVPGVYSVRSYWSSRVRRTRKGETGDWPDLQSGSRLRCENNSKKMKLKANRDAPSRKRRAVLFLLVAVAGLVTDLALPAFGQTAAKPNTATGTITTPPGPQVGRTATEQRVKAIETIDVELAEIKASVQPLAESIAIARQRAESEDSMDADVAMLEAVADAAFRGKFPIARMAQLAGSAAEITDQQAAEVGQATGILRGEIKFQTARSGKLRQMHDDARSAVAVLQERFQGLNELPRAKREIVANALFTAGALNRLSASAGWTTDEMQAALDDLAQTEIRLRDRAAGFRGMAFRSEQTAQILQLQAANIRSVAATWKTTRSNDEFDRQSESLAKGLSEVGRGFSEIAGAPMPDRPPRRNNRTTLSGEDEVLAQLRAFPTGRATTNSNLVTTQP